MQGKGNSPTLTPGEGTSRSFRECWGLHNIIEEPSEYTRLAHCRHSSVMKESMFDRTGNWSQMFGG